MGMVEAWPGRTLPQMNPDEAQPREIRISRIDRSSLASRYAALALLEAKRGQAWQEREAQGEHALSVPASPTGARSAPGAYQPGTNSGDAARRTPPGTAGSTQVRGLRQLMPGSVSLPSAHAGASSLAWPRPSLARTQSCGRDGSTSPPGRTLCRSQSQPREGEDPLSPGKRFPGCTAGIPSHGRLDELPEAGGVAAGEEEEGSRRQQDREGSPGNAGLGSRERPGGSSQPVKLLLSARGGVPVCIPLIAQHSPRLNRASSLDAALQASRSLRGQQMPESSFAKSTSCPAPLPVRSPKPRGTHGPVERTDGSERVDALTDEAEGSGVDSGNGSPVSAERECLRQGSAATGLPEAGFSRLDLGSIGCSQQELVAQEVAPSIALLRSGSCSLGLKPLKSSLRKCSNAPKGNKQVQFSSVVEVRRVIRVSSALDLTQMQL